MPLAEVKLEIGKSYSVDYVIRELEKAPEVQLGHILIVATGEHVYHVNKLRLEKDVAKKIKRVIKEGGEEYKKRGKKFIPLSDIVILSIIDPYAKYDKYNTFYTSFIEYVEKGIMDSAKGIVAAPTDAILDEAKKIIELEDEEDFLDGLGIFFKIKNIDTKVTSGGKYIVFEKIRSTSVKRVALSNMESEYYKYSQYTSFYDDFFKKIVEGIATSKKGEIAAPIGTILTEAEKLGFAVKGQEKGFLRGVEMYFDIRGIKMTVMQNKYVSFKKKG